MSTRHRGPHPAGARQRPGLGTLALLALFFVHSACAPGIPLGGPSTTSGHRSHAPTESAAGSSAEPVLVYEVDELVPGSVSTRPVPVDKREFQQALQRLSRELRLEEEPREAARALLEARLEWEGDWLAEVYKDRVLTLAPEDERGLLSPLAEETFRRKYLGYCESRGGGDCQGLFTDGPSLRADDRRTLALALAFGSVLDESREALARELDVRALLATLVWMVGLYCMLWLVPEPAFTKGVAATLTLLLVAWLGVDTVWGLMDGWAKLATRAHEATTFEELREAGEQFAKVMGTSAARALILAVATLTGRTLGEIAAGVRSLPSYHLAAAQWQAQGLQVPLPVAVRTVEVVAASSEGTLTVLTSPQGALAGAMLSRNASASGHSSSTTILRHRAGNQQVLLGNGQRWHLPRGRSHHDIPASDPLGDALQAAARRIASQWGPGKLTYNERDAIREAVKQGKHFQAARLEGQARGRWVERKLRQQFEHLKWNTQGVDITGPQGQTYHYEVLSGTTHNFGLHGRRMSDVFFRMIYF